MEKHGRKKMEKNARNATEFLVSIDLGKVWPPLASPMIQVNLPGSLDAILFLAIAVVYQYFPAAPFHYELLIHVQLSNVESNTLGP